MQVLSGILIQLGAGLGLLGGVLVGVAMHREALARALGSARVVGCGALGAMTETPKRVLVTGRVRPAPGGAVVAPVSGAECAWFRVRVETSPGTESPGPVHQWDSSERFTVADGSGEVQVAAQLIDRHLDDEDIIAGMAAGLLEWDILPDGKHPKTLTMLRDAGLDVPVRRGEWYRIREFRLPVDRTITVLGRPRRDGRATLLTRAAVSGVSERAIEDLRSAARATVKDLGSFPRAVLYTAGALLGSGVLLQLLG